MKAAVVRHAGAVPEYGEFDDPVAKDGEVLVAMHAAALSNLTRARAAGTHYSSDAGASAFVPGVDGVGRTEDGRRVYLVLPRAPFGAMGERCPMRERMLVPIPDGVSDVAAAAMGNPGMSSWAALHDRARFVAGETVLVNGATGTSGALAVKVAKYLGAKRVTATGRDAAALEALGADETFNLREDEATLLPKLQAEFENGIDVVLDYLWGAPAELLLRALPDRGSSRDGVAIRFVQVGSIAGQTITLPGAWLRQGGLQLMGSGLGSVPMDRLLAGIGEFFKAIEPAGLRVDFVERPLTEVTAAWKEDSTARIVLTM